MTLVPPPLPQVRTPPGGTAYMRPERVVLFPRRFLILASPWMAALNATGHSHYISPSPIPRGNKGTGLATECRLIKDGGNFWWLVQELGSCKKLFEISLLVISIR